MEIYEDLYWTYRKEFLKLFITDFYLFNFKLKSKLLPLNATDFDYHDI